MRRSGKFDSAYPVHDLPGSCQCRLRWADVDSSLCPERLSVTVVASSLSAKQLIASRSSGLIERYCWVRCRNRQLIKLQRGKLRGNEIVVRVNVGQIRKAVRGRNWELRRVVQARIEEPAFPVHFEIGYESVPVWYGTTADPGVEVYSDKTKGGRNQGGT